MGMPILWIDRLFERLTLRYGHDFTRRWEGFDLNAVKADWQLRLDRFDADSIRYGLEHLPSEAPNANDFAAICNKSPRRDDVLELPAPQSKMPEEIASQLAAVRAKLESSQANPYHEWAHRLKEKQEAGEKLSAAQRDALQRFDANVLA